MTRYLIMLLADVLALPQSPEGRRVRGRLLRLGRPVVERAGVLNRRVMWAHDFPSEWADGLRTIEFDDGTTMPANLTSTRPVNWRYPLP